MGFRELDSWAVGVDTGAEVVGSGPVLGASGPETGGAASLESGGTILSQMLEEGAGNCTVLFVAAGFELFILFVVVIVVVLLLLLFPLLLFVSLILILALLDKGLNRLDFITTVRGGREPAEEAAISAPFTGDTRTIRMAPPCPGTLTSFTGTILAPGRIADSWWWVVPPPAAVAADSVVTVIDVDMVDDGLLVVNNVGWEEMKAGVAMVTTLLLTEPDVSRMVLVIVLPIVLATTAVGVVIVVNGSCCIICCGLISTVSLAIVTFESSLITPSTQAAEPCFVSMSNRSGDTLSSAPSQERMRSESGSSTGESPLALTRASACT